MLAIHRFQRGLTPIPRISPHPTHVSAQPPKFGLDNEEWEDLLADYLPWCEPVTILEAPVVPECRDPFDRPFLELALFAGADALVTGEKDLLSLARPFAVPIITANELRKSW